jgi:hypothetical protein
MAAKSSNGLWNETTAITKDVVKEGLIAHTDCATVGGNAITQGKDVKKGCIATGFSPFRRRESP